MTRAQQRWLDFWGVNPAIKQVFKWLSAELRDHSRRMEELERRMDACGGIEGLVRRCEDLERRMDRWELALGTNANGTPWVDTSGGQMHGAPWNAWSAELCNRVHALSSRIDRHERRTTEYDREGWPMVRRYHHLHDERYANMATHVSHFYSLIFEQISHHTLFLLAQFERGDGY